MSNVESDAERGGVPALGAYFIIPLLACGLTIYYLVSTVDLIWEAKSTGIFIGVVLLALCVGQFVRLGLKVARGEATLGLGDLAENSYFNRLRFGLLLLAVLFVALLPVIGTTLGLFLVLIAMIRLMGVTNWRVLIGIAFVTAAIVHTLLIKLLDSQLPQGLLKPVYLLLGL